MTFEWDEIKNQENRRKHGVWFEEAQTVFEDDDARVFLDDRNSEDEDRFVIVGVSSTARILVIVHCFRQNDQIIRIVSARKATKKERAIYEERI